MQFKKATLAAALVVASLASPALAAPGDMLASDFLQRAERLQARGMMAMFSGDAKLLMGEATAAGQAYRARLSADKAAGRPPHSCPPPRSGLNSEQLLAHLRSYTPEQRARTSMRAAMADLFVKTFPCH